MKNWFTIIGILLCKGIIAQTNTFPPSGKVGIGTLNPLNPLHICETSSDGGTTLRLDDAMSISSNGNVGIGTISPDARLTVNGNIHTREVKVDLNGAVTPDYVFEESYELPTLTALESYIGAHKHLPDIPSEEEVKTGGVSLGEMNARLLKKIEELTLYSIEQHKQIKELQQSKHLNNLQRIALESRVAQLENYLCTDLIQSE